MGIIDQMQCCLKDTVGRDSRENPNIFLHAFVNLCTTGSIPDELMNCCDGFVSVLYKKCADMWASFFEEFGESVHVMCF